MVMIDNDKSSLVQVMALRRASDKSSPAPMMTLFADAYMRQGELNSMWPSDAIWRETHGSTIGSGIRLLPNGTKPLPINLYD